jgi:hypothetical protein
LLDPIPGCKAEITIELPDPPEQDFVICVVSTTPFALVALEWLVELSACTRPLIVRVQSALMLAMDIGTLAVESAGAVSINSMNDVSALSEQNAKFPWETHPPEPGVVRKVIDPPLTLIGEFVLPPFLPPFDK